jgi:DNA-binding transcriptional MerR regulator
MRRLSRLVLFATALLGAGGACSSDEDPTDATTPKVEAVRPTLADMVCEPVTILEVAHRVGGRIVTDRVRIDDDTAGSGALVLRSFRATALHFGDSNVVSSRRITQVQCFPVQAGLTRSSGRLADPPTDGTLCANPSGVYDCTTPTPSQVFDVSSGESCNVRNYSEAVSLSCQDSSAIVTRSGDIVVTVNTENLRNDVLSRTQALRRLVGDENVVANFHFDVVINPDQQAAIIGNQAFNDLAEQIRQASEAGRQIPDIGDFLRWLPQPPANADAYAALTKAQEMMQERLQLLAKVTEGAPLSPQQVNAFYRAFVEKSRLVDRLDVQNSASARNEATSIITETIDQLASANRGSPTYEQLKAGAEAMLEAHTSEGVFDPDRTLDFVVPDLQSSLTDEDVEKRMVAAEMLIKLNEVLLRDDGVQRAKDLLPPMQQIVLSLQNDALDRVWRLYDLVEATEFFFDNEDPAGTSYDVHLSHDARALFNIEVEPTSAMAVEVINLLNETAEYDRETGRVTVNYQAVIVINARQALSATDLKKALYLTEASHGILGFLRANAPAFLAGSLKNLGETATGVFYMAGDFIRDPEAFLENLKSAIVNWDQTLEIILDQGLDVIHRWPNMTTEEKSELLGRLAAEVLLSLPAQARRASNVNEVIRDASRLHLDNAARGLRFIERGGVALSPEAAIELTARMERYGVTDLDEAIRFADALDDLLPCRLVGSAAPLTHLLAALPPCNVAQIAATFGWTNKLQLIAPNRWRSPAGLIYGRDNNFGNRVCHVLSHMVPDPTKPTHSVFSVRTHEVLDLVDEAWRKRGASVPGDQGAFVVPMGRVVGTNNETSVRVVVEAGTTNIITAYPWP